MKAVIYTRFSPRRNGEECHSCSIQEAICRDHAYAQGWPVGTVYADKDVSGGAERPNLERAIEDLSKGDVLLVSHRDRIARDVLIAELTRRKVQAAGAAIVAVDGDVTGNDPTSIFVRQIMDAVAELERKQIGQRTRASMLQHQRNGRRMSYHAPYGYRTDPLDPSLLEPEPLEQAAIEEINRLLGGGLTRYAVTKKMNETMPEAARNGKWNAKTINNILVRQQTVS